MFFSSYNRAWSSYCVFLLSYPISWWSFPFSGFSFFFSTFPVFIRFLPLVWPHPLFIVCSLGVDLCSIFFHFRLSTGLIFLLACVSCLCLYLRGMSMSHACSCFTSRSLYCLGLGVLHHHLSVAVPWLDYQFRCEQLADSLEASGPVVALMSFSPFCLSSIFFRWSP